MIQKSVTQILRCVAPNIVMQRRLTTICTPIISRLTIATELSIKEDMKLIDINGIPHPLSQGQVRVIMAIGWICFLLSWAFNTLFYKVNDVGILTLL